MQEILLVFERLLVGAVRAEIYQQGTVTERIKLTFEVLSAVDALLCDFDWYFSILVNKICKIMKIFG